MEIIFENTYGRTLEDGTDQIYCIACGGWCSAEQCSCGDCRAAWLEYRESLKTDDIV